VSATGGKDRFFGSRVSNLRIRIFAPVFVLACGAALAWVFSRPAVYVSTARLQVEAPKSPGQGDEADKIPNLVNATQALTASVVLDQVRPYVPPAPPGADPLRGMLSAAPIERSNVIQLRAEGPNGALLPQVLSAWVEAYRRTRSESFAHSWAAALEDALSTVEKLKEDAAAQRLALDEFRRKNDIVAIERDENQATARLRSLTAALNEARNRQVDAEARLSSMRANLAAGKAAPEAIDGSNVPDLERRASDVRERMRDLEQEFTPQFLRFEPKYQALRTNLARLEQQIEQERRAGTGRALQKVGQEAESARQNVARLQEELKGLKREVQDFTVRFSENTRLANELARLEKAHESARERVAQLEAEKKARPALKVLSLPTVPERPERPDYARDAAIAVTGAALLGILAVWFVEFFRRSGVPRPAPLTQPVINISLAPGMALDQGMRVIGATAARELTVNTARLPGIAAVFPRELSDAEVRALWQAATPGARIAIAGLNANVARMPDVSTRACTLREPLRRLLIEEQRRKGGEAPLADTRGMPLSVADIEGLIACAAHDAGLANPDELTADSLRHTYLTYLIRQGTRLAEIGEFVGHVAPAVFRDYARLSPPGPGLALEDIDPVFPALRDR
jgi:uncharacterized protein involved in exopolysaccharide biosynthesis